MANSDSYICLAHRLHCCQAVDCVAAFNAPYDRVRALELQIDEMRKAMEFDRGHSESCTCVKEKFAEKPISEKPRTPGRCACGSYLGHAGECVEKRMQEPPKDNPWTPNRTL